MQYSFLFFSLFLFLARERKIYNYDTLVTVLVISSLTCRARLFPCPGSAHRSKGMVRGEYVGVIHVISMFRRIFLYDISSALLLVYLM